jgi:hypothetical protein
MVQIHDFNPGFGKEVSPVGSNGFGTRTFWTAAIPDDDVEVHFAAGKAEMRVHNLHLADYGTLANATGANFQTAFDPAVVSFDVVWSGPITRRVHVRDGTLGNNYAGEYVENQVTVSWSGKNLATGFSFTSNPGTFATSFRDGGFAELGHERNGIFARSDEDAEGDSGHQGDDQGGHAAVARDALAATPAGQGQPIQPASARDGLSVGEAHLRALDEVFADLADSTLADALGAGDVPAWVV